MLFLQLLVAPRFNKGSNAERTIAIELVEKKAHDGFHSHQVRQRILQEMTGELNAWLGTLYGRY